MTSSLSQQAKSQLSSFRETIDKEINEFFKIERKAIKNAYSPFSVFAMDVFRDITSRDAKRLRGSFVYYTYQMYDGGNLSEAMKAAVAIEIIHAYLLVEDDFMDLSETRRKGPTAHMIFSDFHEKNYIQKDPLHFGDSMAVVTGLYGAHLAMRLLNELDFDAETIVRANWNLNDRLVTTSHGQISDVVNEVVSDLAQKDIINTLKWKTGAYTYENPIHLGAILAGAKDSELEKLGKYALPAGIAFQIQDDILGTFGDEKDTGKSNMDDLKEGKITLLVYKALTDGSEKQKKLLRKALGNRNLTENEHQDVQKVLIDTGSLEYSKRTAMRFVKRAKKSLLDNFNQSWGKEGVEYLLGIADYMIERKL